MNALEFLRQPEQALGNRLFLLCGKELYLLDAMYSALLAQLVKQPEMNLSRFEEDVAPGSIIAACEQMPCFAERRVVAVRDCQLFEKGNADELVRYLANLPETTALIFYCINLPDKRKALYRAVKEHGVILEAEPLADTELPGWVLTQAKKAKLSLSKVQAQLLIGRSGHDMFTLKNEIAKLASLGKREPTDQEIAACASETPDYLVFEFHNDMIEEKYDAAAALLQVILTEEKSVLGLLGATVNKFRLMYMARACLNAGMSPATAQQSIVARAGVNPGQARYAVAECRRYSAKHLRLALHQLTDYDFAQKTGRPANDPMTFFLRIYASK